MSNLGIPEQTIKEMQELLDKLRKEPAFEAYIQARQLSLIDERLAVIDKLLLLGVLK